MKLPETGDEIDGFRIGPLIHSGAMGLIYAVTYAGDRPDPGFPMVMKIPRSGAGDGPETITGFEVEHQMLQVLTGPHVPRFVAAGDLTRLPYLVIERIPGQTLDAYMEAHPQPSDGEIVALGLALCTALQSLHRQNACHHDLKPANVMLRPDGTVVLLDFGLAHHAHYPDFLAEELRQAVGSPAWMAPEQVLGVRGDPRSDLFAIGVMLYQLATGTLPFGDPETKGGLRQRLWLEPRPPRALRPDTPAWLQEVILKALEPRAQNRYPSAAHLAFDLSHPEQVQLTERAQRLRRRGLWAQLKNWLRASGMEADTDAVAARRIDDVPIVMVALPHRDVTDATLYSLRESAARSLGLRPGARLACVTVLPPQIGQEEAAADASRRHLARLRHWAQGLDLTGHQASFHVIEADDVAHALLRYAQTNQVHLIIMGAATHGLSLQHIVATVPMRVAMRAPCTVMLVKQGLPFGPLAEPETRPAAHAGS